MAEGEAPREQVEDCAGLLLGVHTVELGPQEVGELVPLVHGGRLGDLQQIPLGLHCVASHPQAAIVSGPKGEVRQLQGAARAEGK